MFKLKYIIYFSYNLVSRDIFVSVIYLFSVLFSPNLGVGLMKWWNEYSLLGFLNTITLKYILSIIRNMLYIYVVTIQEDMFATMCRL